MLLWHPLDPAVASEESPSTDKKEYTVYTITCSDGGQDVANPLYR